MKFCRLFHFRLFRRGALFLLRRLHSFLCLFNRSLHYHWFISEGGSCCVSVHLPCSVIQISKIRFYMQCTLAIDQYHRR
ncbi:hypothetical protein V6N13_146851 [Hibiscus sabdariffa]